jgi:hypothetical protein
MGLSLFGAWVVHFFEASDEVGEGFDVEHFDLREGKGEANPFRLCNDDEEKKDMLGEKKEKIQKKTKYL